MPRRFVGLVRVSSREQEREGFSLDVQEDALLRYAQRHEAEMVKLFRIAETASKREERATFRELLVFVRRRETNVDGVLFYKVDRAARNLFDYVDLERLEADQGIEVIYVSQPTENTPAGRMQRRMLANMASFYTEQQSLDVREGMERRVKSGLFVGRAPYGYRNVRSDGRGLVEVDSEEAAAVRRIFELYAYHGHTLDTLRQALADMEIHYTPRQPRFSRSKVHEILRDRCYIGEVNYRGNWFPGAHEAIVDRAVWDRVQVLLGAKIYRSHELAYGGNLIKCGHCGRAITGERIVKRTREGEREYFYYRCAGYTAKEHPRVRLAESKLDTQVLLLFAKLRIEDDAVRNWFLKVLQAKAEAARSESEDTRDRLEAELKLKRKQSDTLLAMRLTGEIDSELFTRKSKELQGEIDRLKGIVERGDKAQAEYGEMAVKAFELSQTLRERWLSGDAPTKRHILDIVCLNFTLDGVNLIPTLRKPFDALVNTPIIENGRGERI